MLDWRHSVAIIAALAGGCGTIVEVPVGDASTGANDSTSSSTATTSTATGQPDGTVGLGTSADTDGDTEGWTTSSGSQGSSSTGKELVSIPICGNPSFIIPEDGTWAEAPIEVPAQPTVLDLDVAVRVVHRYVSQLRIRLRAPDGTVVSLIDTPTCEGAGLDAVFDDDAGRSAEDACDPSMGSAISGAVEPLDPLAPLLSDPVEGTWILEITDATPANEGMIEQACIILTVEAG